MNDFAGIGAAKKNGFSESISTECKHQQASSLRPIEPLQGVLVDDQSQLGRKIEESSRLLAPFGDCGYRGTHDGAVAMA